MIYKLSKFPCGNIIFTTITSIIYLYDNKFNFLKKEENNEFNDFCIKDDITFATYNNRKIKIWNINQKNYIFNFISIIDLSLQFSKIDIIKNGDILGITNNSCDYEGPYEFFIYQKSNKNNYEKKCAIKFNKLVISFIITKNNKDLVICSRKNIYIYEYKNLKLKEGPIKYGNDYRILLKSEFILLEENIIALIQVIDTNNYYGSYDKKSQIFFLDLSNNNNDIAKNTKYLFGNVYSQLIYFPTKNIFIITYSNEINYVSLYNLLKGFYSPKKTWISGDFMKLDENNICNYKGNIIRIYEIK